MDIYECLVADHRKVAALIDDLLAINLQHVQQTIFTKIKIELTAHAAAEEATFYKAISGEAHDVHIEKDVDHAVYEHDDIRKHLEQLSEEAATSPKWMLMFGELKHAIEHHVEQEETEVFSEARKVLGTDQAFTLANEFITRKQEIMAHLQPIDAEA